MMRGAVAAMLVVAMTITGCSGGSESSPIAVESPRPTLFDPYTNTPEAVAPTYIPPIYRRKVTFCDSARNWAIEIGIFLRQFGLARQRGNRLHEQMFDAYADSARGLRDAAEDGEEAAYSDLADLRDKLLNTFARYNFRWDRIPARHKRLLRRERRATQNIFAELAPRCGISQRHVRKGIKIITDLE